MSHAVPLTSVRRRAAVLFTAVASLAFLGAAVTPTARAQSPAPVESPAPVAESAITIPNEKPEVQIVVLGIGPGQWAVSSTYPKKISEAEAKGRIQRLLALTKWRIVGEPHFSNNSTSFQQRPLNNLSSISFITTDPVVDIQGGSLDLTPFVRAFSDLSRINLSFFMPQGFPAYRGLRTYSDKNIDVALAEGQGSVTYVANIKNHNLDSLTLPRFQDPATATVSSASEDRSGKNGGHGRNPLAIVLIAALGAGLVAFAVVKAILSRSR